MDKQYARGTTLAGYGISEIFVIDTSYVARSERQVRSYRTGFSYFVVGDERTARRYIHWYEHSQQIIEIELLHNFHKKLNKGNADQYFEIFFICV